MRPMVAIVGRPNVGKSTLFNRICGLRKAIVEDTPGVTRDRHFGDADWAGHGFLLVDTGGFEIDTRDELREGMRRQAQMAIDDAIVIMLVVDGQEGLCAADEDLARMLRRSGKPTILVANKLDSDKREAETGILAELSVFGFEAITVSAEHGRGLNDLLDALISELQGVGAIPKEAHREKKSRRDRSKDEDPSLFEAAKELEPEADDLEQGIEDEESLAGDEEHIVPNTGSDEASGEALYYEEGESGAELDTELDEEESPQVLAAKARRAKKPAVIRLAVIGRPNVGKSTLLNALLGEERFLATEVAGTTRDSLDAELNYRNCKYILTDTAGIRRRRSVEKGVEQVSTMRALAAVEASDVAVLVMDAMEPAVSQDARLARLCVDRGRAILIVVNKWDLAVAQGQSPDALRAAVREALPEVDHAPILLSSALEGKRVFPVLEEAALLHERQNTRIPTPELNRFVERVNGTRPAPIAKGRANRLVYMNQMGVKPPRFTLQCSRPEDMPESYTRFLMNQLREMRDFRGVPLRIYLRSRSGRH